jgi:hypothetical protein
MSTMPNQLPDNRDLVEVFDTNEESEAMVVRGLLESAGIEALITGLDSPQDILPGVGGVIVRVAAQNADEARHIIDEYRANPSAED